MEGYKLSINLEEELLRSLAKARDLVKSIGIESTKASKSINSALRNTKQMIKSGHMGVQSIASSYKSAVKASIDNPGKMNLNLVDAQQARRVLDRLVGYKISPVLWRKVRRGLSAGRVQSVALRLIVEREREREAFKPEEYWEIAVAVDSLNRNLKQLNL